MSIRLMAVAVVVAGFAVPVAAQHGGASSGRGGGGVAGAPASRGGSASMMGRPGSVGMVQFRIGQSSGPILVNRAAPVGSGHRMGFGVGDANRRRSLPGERPGQRAFSSNYFGLGLPYSVGWVGAGYPGYPDADFYDNSAMTAPGPDSDVQPVQQQAEAAPEPAPVSAYRPVYQRPLSPPAEPEPEDPVTLVFKDGRPREQIHNYMLTRTTLYVQGKRLREIAVADLDLDATAKVNREAGVDFRLPDSGK